MARRRGSQLPPLLTSDRVEAQLAERRHAAADAERRVRRNRSLRRHLLGFLVVIALMSTAFAVHVIANPARTEAEQVVAVLDDTYTAARAGDLVLTAEPVTLDGGVLAAAIELRDETLGAAVGEAGGECYALWWGEDGVQHPRVLGARLDCLPTADVTSLRTGDTKRGGSAVPEGTDVNWERLLPDPLAQRVWFLPVMIVLGGVALSLAVRISVIAITGRPPGEVRR